MWASTIMMIVTLSVFDRIFRRDLKNMVFLTLKEIFLLEKLVCGNHIYLFIKEIS